MVDSIAQYELLNKYLKLSMFPVAVRYFQSLDKDLEWDLRADDAGAAN